MTTAISWLDDPTVGSWVAAEQLTEHGVVGSLVPPRFESYISVRLAGEDAAAVNPDRVLRDHLVATLKAYDLRQSACFVGVSAIRSYMLYRGDVDDAAAAAQAGNPTEIPDLWWPEHRGWFVATDTDLTFVLVGGARQLTSSFERPGVYVEEVSARSWSAWPRARTELSGAGVAARQRRGDGTEAGYARSRARLPASMSRRTATSFRLRVSASTAPRRSWNWSRTRCASRCGKCRPALMAAAKRSARSRSCIASSASRARSTASADASGTSSTFRRVSGTCRRAVGCPFVRQKPWPARPDDRACAGRVRRVVVSGTIADRGAGTTGAAWRPLVATLRARTRTAEPNSSSRHDGTPP